MCRANRQCWFPKVIRDYFSARSTDLEDILNESTMETLTFNAGLKMMFYLVVKKISSDLPSPNRRGYHIVGFKP